MRSLPVLGKHASKHKGPPEGTCGKTVGCDVHELGMTTNTAHSKQPLGASRPCRGAGPPVDVVEWRRCRLVEAGFDEELARRIGADPDMDVHALLDLVDRGCAPALAVRILAPL